MLKEFRQFAMRGNVVDMAIGIIIGGAFGKIVASLVSDILMPPIGLLVARLDIRNLFLSLGAQSYPTLAEAQAAGIPTLNYGTFLQTIVDFVIIAFAVFLLVRQVNRLTRAPAPPPGPPTTRSCPFCLSTIAIQATRCAHCTSEVARA